MSWSTYIGPTAAADIKASLDVAPLPPELAPHVQEQVDKAKATALAIVKSGVIGDADAHFFVSLSGHANPGHVPAEGWANDCISVSVSQATVATEPVEVEEDTSDQAEEQPVE